MKYRIKERVNLLNNNKAFVVEQLCDSICNVWGATSYYDEKGILRDAVFETLEDAKAFAKNGGVIGERIVWEGEDE